MPDPISLFESAPFNGPFSLSSLLLDSVTAAGYEGVWVPTKFLKYATVEVEGSFSSLSISLYGTNLDSVGAVNQNVLTIGGSVTASDVITLTFANANLAGGTEAVAYTAHGGDTTTTIATALAAAINADANLKALGFAATSNAAVVTVTFPSIPQSGELLSPSSPGSSNATRITSSVSGSATETIAITAGSNGTLLGSAITAAGLTSLANYLSLRYIKARLTTLTGSNASVSAALQGAG
jgi:hypothetical protein